MKNNEWEYITAQELADTLKISLETIRRWNNDGMPRTQLSAGAYRYQLGKVLEWRAEVMAAKKRKGGVGIGKK